MSEIVLRKHIGPPEGEEMTPRGVCPPPCQDFYLSGVTVFWTLFRRLFSSGFFLCCGNLALSEGDLAVQSKLTPKMHLFVIHFQRVKSCESIVNSVQIAFWTFSQNIHIWMSLGGPFGEPFGILDRSLYSSREGSSSLRMLPKPT